MYFSRLKTSSDDKGILNLMTHLHHMSHEMIDCPQHPEMAELSRQAVADIYQSWVAINKKYIELKSAGEI